MSWLGIGREAYGTNPYDRPPIEESPPTIYDETIDAEGPGYDPSLPATDVPQSVIDLATSMFPRPAKTSSPPKPTYGPAPPPDQAVTQRAVAQANARTSTSTSAHAQVARIRAAQAAAAAARRRAASGAMTNSQQRQAILAVRSRNQMGAGTKIALGVVGGLALLSLVGLAFGGIRR